MLQSLLILVASSGLVPTAPCPFDAEDTRTAHNAPETGVTSPGERAVQLPRGTLSRVRLFTDLSTVKSTLKTHSYKNIYTESRPEQLFHLGHRAGNYPHSLALSAGCRIGSCPPCASRSRSSFSWLPSLRRGGQQRAQPGLEPARSEFPRPGIPRSASTGAAIKSKQGLCSSSGAGAAGSQRASRNRGFCIYFTQELQLRTLKEMGRTSRAVLLVISCVLMTVKAFEMEITPANRIVKQVGETLRLTCKTTGCASPSFSWRTQMDNPLGGTVNSYGTYSTLTMNPVSAVNSHDYLCTVFCGEKEKKEKSVKVEIYSFPRDPVIEISPSSAAAEPVTVTCKVLDVYPSHYLEVLLKKEDHVLREKNFYEDESTNTENKTVTYSFNPTAEDIGKEITCVAKLPIPNLDFEPKERVTSEKLTANFGPQNTVITTFPSKWPMEGDTLNLTCVTESNPPAQIVWRRHLADESIQLLTKTNVLSIPDAHFNDSGLYICEVTNLVTNKTEKATVDIVIQGAPDITELSVEPSATVQEGETVSIRCSAEGNPSPRMILRRKSDGADMGPYSEGRILLPSVTFLNGGDYECVAENKFGKSRREITLNVEYGPKNTMISVIPATAVKEGETVIMKCTSSGNPAPVISWKKKKTTGEPEKIYTEATLTIKNIKSQDLGVYECEAYNQFGKEEKDVKLLVQERLAKPDQMIPLVIAFSSVTAVAVPAVAILIYVSRKAKINGSYSLVKALRLKV